MDLTNQHRIPDAWYWGRIADHTRSESTNSSAVTRGNGNKHLPESERSQIGHHPGSPCSQESQDAFGPIKVSLWASEQVWNPHQHPKERQHERHHAHRKPCPAIDENGNCRECKRDRRKNRPKHLAGRNPLWNQVSCLTQKECLPQRKGNGTDAESKSRQAAEYHRPGSIRLARSV
jgi:hypothetical protein